VEYLARRLPKTHWVYLSGWLNRWLTRPRG